jgi:capsular polysaccharide biosynthesis protein
MSSSSGQELQLLSIERQQQIIQNLYIFLLQKREENELAALINVGNTRVIMNPNGSSSPVEPHRMMILFAAIVIGCGIPFAFYFLKRMLDNTVKTKADLGNISMPFLVEIPRVVNEDSKFRNLWFRNDNDKSMTRIMVQNGNRDMINEAFRVLRTNIDLMVDKSVKSHVLMFTSFNPNAGKTFTIMNLAASMALKGSVCSRACHSLIKINLIAVKIRTVNASKLGNSFSVTDKRQSATATHSRTVYHYRIH